MVAGVKTHTVIRISDFCQFLLTNERCFPRENWNKLTTELAALSRQLGTVGSSCYLSINNSFITVKSLNVVDVYELSIKRCPDRVLRLESLSNFLIGQD